MMLNKRFILIIAMTVMILAAIAVVPIHKRLIPPATASTSGSPHNPHKRMNSAASAVRTATPAVDDGSEMIGAHSHAQLTAQFWRWFYSIPVGVDPNSDTTGVNCGINQEGDVWFLAGPASGNSSVTCTVPAGKTIVSAVFAYIDDYPCPDPNFRPPQGQSLEEFLLQDSAPFIDGATAMAQLDGMPRRVKRIKSRLFSFTAAASQVVNDPCVTGSPQLGVSDGFFVFIEPLRRGDHILQLSWNGPSSNPSGTRMVRLTITRSASE